MGLEYYSMKDKMLSINVLEESYNRLPADIKNALVLRSDQIEIGGFKQFLTYFFDRCMKYQKSEIEYAKIKFLSIFFENTHLIKKISLLKEKEEDLTNKSNGQDKRIISANNSSKKEEVRNNVGNSKETTTTEIKTTGLTLSSDNNIGGEIVTTGCTPEVNGMIKYESVVFPTNGATQDINSNNTSLDDSVSNVSTGYTDIQGKDTRDTLMLHINPAVQAISMINYTLPNLRREFGKKFDTLFI